MDIADPTLAAANANMGLKRDTRLTKKVESSKWQDRYSVTCLRANVSC